MERIITVENMRKSDAYTIANFIESKDLMYKAGLGVFNSYNFITSNKVAIVCGSGNNAGDGYVLALLLKKKNIDVKIFLIKEKFSHDGKYYFDKCMEQGIPYFLCNEYTDFTGYTVIVDCIFGTGFQGKPRGNSQLVIEKINKAPAYTISVDINSGLNGDTGFAEFAVKSDLTVSIGYFKTGHFINDAPKYIGRLVNCDIDISLVEDCFYLVTSFDEDIADANIYESYNSFEEENSPIEHNPIEAINSFTTENKNRVLVKNIGEYSVFSDKGKTVIFTDKRK